ncbi:GNAT family N-acetyltransferase [Ruminococcaceae bacterium OttesenSCG-928-L11]|nr:GNAT family N-acetyltransferase [Ruminococcaceae bacterium OttesenSCG-928-L11]
MESVYRIAPMEAASAGQILGWRYDGIYSLYDFGEEDGGRDELMSGAYYAAFGPDGALVGYYCYGQAAVIPTTDAAAYPDGYLDIGLGMRPDLCGKGLGYRFLLDGLAFGRQAFHAKTWRLTVASFNRRAIKVYRRAGFREGAVLVHGGTGEQFQIMTMESAGPEGV